jgi:predicted deacylase
MKAKFILFIALLFTTMINLYASDYQEYYFKVPYQSNKKINELNEICSVDKFDKHFVYAYANPQEFAKVILNFPKYQLLTNPSKEFQVPMAKNVSEMRDWDSYPSYSTYVTMMNQFAIDYPNLCSVETIGMSVDNREIIVAKISDNVAIDEAEPKFFYSGQMHGDEIVCSILFLRLIDYLLENYASDPEISQIINNSQIYINPLANPDGLYTDNDESVYGATRYNANGVDLNRNYPGANGNPNPDDNPVQVENLAMMNFAEEHRFVMSSNSHSGVVVVNYPWDTWPRLHPDDDWFQYVSRLYADTVQENAPAPYMTDFENGITNGFAWYVAIGSRQDWFNYYRNCREITIELSFNKTVPANQLNAHWEYNYQAMIEWLKQVQYGIRGFISDAQGNPLEAKIEILNHEEDNSFVFSSPLHGDYYRPIAAGTYSVIASAPGYESQIIDNVSVQYDSATQVNFVLNPAVLTSVQGNILDQASQPIADATVTFTGSSNYSTSTDTEGYFAIADIYSGNYTLTVSASGYQTNITEIQISENNPALEISLEESTAISFENELSADWFSSSNNPWTRTNNEAFDGAYSLRSGIIGNDASSNIQIETETQAAVISFYYKVSSEDGYDFFSFYINDDLRGSWSGEIDWSYAEFPVNAGTNTFKWVYEKDGYVQDGSDCAWIDLVQLPSTTENSNNDIMPLVNQLSCYPNPFNPCLNIRYYQSLDKPIDRISIYNLKGQKVRDLINLSKKTGYHTIQWNGRNDNGNDLSSGLYFISIDNDNSKFLKKVILMK